MSEPDLSLPNIARIYDWLLGGSRNFAVDREFGERIVAQKPLIREMALANRAFLPRAVGACLDAGCRQFLDLGAGIPAEGAVHEIAQRRDPGARVAYVDAEPVAVASGHEALDGIDGVSVTEADLRDVDAVLTAPGVAGLLDFRAPVAVLAAAVLHFVPDDGDLLRLIERYTAALAPGSMLVCTHIVSDDENPEVAEMIRALDEFTRGTTQPSRARDRDLLHRMVTGYDLIEPGMVDVTQWRPEPGGASRPVGLYAMVGTLRR